MTSFLYRAPSGVAGDVTRPDDTVVESALINASVAPTAFGVPVKMTSGKIEAIEEGDAATDFFGVISRVAPAINGSLVETFGSGTPNTDQVQGVVVEGYINVKCAVGTPTRNGAVYMRIAPDTGKAVGDFETALVTDETVLLAGVTWAIDGKDSSNVTEIRIK